jgi:hypothetical protein
MNDNYSDDDISVDDNIIKQIKTKSLFSSKPITKSIIKPVTKSIIKPVIKPVTKSVSKISNNNINDDNVDNVDNMDDNNSIKNKDDFSPDMKNSNWCIFDNDNSEFMIYDKKLLPKIEIKNIDQKIEQFKANNINSNNYAPASTDGWNIYRIYKVSDDSTKINDNTGSKTHISYTQSTLDKVIHYDIHNYINRGNKSSKLADFEDCLDTIKYELVGCCRGKGNCVKELNKIKKLYDNGGNVYSNNNKSKSKNNSNKALTTVWDIYDDVFKTEIEKDVILLCEKEYNIYKISNSKNPDEHFIVGDIKNNSTKIEIMEQIRKYCNAACIPEYICKKFDNISLLKTVRCYLECEGLLEVDRLIHENDSTNTGYNKCYNIINSEHLCLNIDAEEIGKLAFMEVQKYIMLETYNDDSNKKMSYVACISNNKSKYIFKDGNKTIKENLHIFYEMTFNQTIMNFFGDNKNRFNDLRIEYLITNVKPHIAEIKYLYYMKQFNMIKNGNTSETSSKLLAKGNTSETSSKLLAKGNTSETSSKLLAKGNTIDDKNKKEKKPNPFMLPRYSFLKKN